MIDNDREEALDGFQTLITYLRNNPQVPIPYSWISDYEVITVSCDEEQIRTVAATAPGTWEKEYDENFLNLRQKFGNLTYEVYVTREKVCTPKVTETVLEDVPDHAWLQAEIKKLRERQPVEKKEVTKVVEWDCHPLLAPTVKEEEPTKEPF